MPPPIAASEVHLNEDIRSIMLSLLATHESTRRMFGATAESEAYTEGFKAATFLLARALNVHLGIPQARHYMER